MSESAKPRRRWFRFSLRALWVFITLLAIGAAWVARERKKSQHEFAIAEQLTARGAFVEFTDRFDHAPTRKQSSLRAFWATVVGPRVISVHMSESPIDDLSPFAALVDMQYLWLDSTKVNDLTPIAGLTNLEWLDLRNTPVRNVVPLAQLTNLQTLDLDETQVSDLSPLEALTNLRHLSLSETWVSSSQVALLQSALPNCKIVFERPSLIPPP